ncbi:MAG: hypothetical protein KDJ77_20200 [Rhodobiaceae bacterium]|nr:hypothetical protein [Rhodobiaceae bacterium]
MPTPVRLAVLFLASSLALPAVDRAGAAPEKVPTETIDLTKKPIPDTAPGIGESAEPLYTNPEDLQNPEIRKPDIAGHAIEFGTDPALLPRGVQRTRERILAAARSGDPEALRPIMESFERPPMVQFDGQTDAVDDLVAQSGDEDGREILAILLEVLESGYAHVDAGTENELYIWPYFAYKRLDTLTPPEMVDLFTLVTAYDLEQMQAFGAYNFYRAGIAPDGQWIYFVTGD